MRFEFDAVGTIKTFERAPELTREHMGRIFDDACRTLLKSCKTSHRFVNRTGNLENSIRLDADYDNLKGTVTLGDTVINAPEGRNKYALAIHNGSKKHDIFPVNKKCLYFRTSKNTALQKPGKYYRHHEGAFTFAKGVTHPGTKPDRFMFKGAQKAKPEIQQIFEIGVMDLAKAIMEG